MKCNIIGCTGEYENKLIPHLACKNGSYLLVKDVPAEVCPVCGDTLLTKETIDMVMEILKNGKPETTIPAMQFNMRDETGMSMAG
ncbi:MAG: YgiT-type zinc finger protein [Ignavibacteria bacterium]